MYALTLEQAGFEVRAVAEAETAYEVACEWLPDVVVTDFLLHGVITGADLCARLQANAATSHIPTIVMTGSTRKSDAEAVLGAGCADIRIKPYLPDQLVEDVSRFLPQSSMHRRTA